MTLCPTCATDWPRDSMSGVSVELLGGCLWCCFGPMPKVNGDDEGLANVRAEYHRRKATVQWVEPKGQR